MPRRWNGSASGGPKSSDHVKEGQETQGRIGQGEKGPPPSFTQMPLMPSADTMSSYSLKPPHTTTTTQDSIPIPSMPPPPAPLPPRPADLPDKFESERPKDAGIASMGKAVQMTRLQRFKAIVLHPIYVPLHAYAAVHKRRPLWTQFVSALVIYLFGDFVAQSIGGLNDAKEEVSDADKEEDTRGWVQKWVEDRDWWRTGRALIIGGVAAVPGFKWFVWLNDRFNYKSKILSLGVKVAINQAVFTPIFNTYFFSMQYFLSSHITPVSPPVAPSMSGWVEHISNTVPRSVYNSCKLWPGVTAFSFAFVKLEYRSLVAGVVAIGWQTYLSILDQRVRRAEAERHALEASGGKEQRAQPVQAEVRQNSAVREISSGGFGQRAEKCAA